MIGIGHLKVQDQSDQGYRYVCTEYNPKLPGTYLSPHTIAKDNHGKSPSIISDYDSNEAMCTIHSRINKHRDIHIPGTLRRALFYTKPLIVPTFDEHRARLPTPVSQVNVANRDVFNEAMRLYANTIEVEDLMSEAGEVNPEENIDRNDPEDFDHENENPGEGNDNVVDENAVNLEDIVVEDVPYENIDNNDIPHGPEVRPDPEPPPRKRRLDDPIFDEDDVVYLNSLNRDAQRLLWHQVI